MSPIVPQSSSILRYYSVAKRVEVRERPNATVVPAPNCASVLNVRPTDPNTPTFDVRAMEMPVEMSLRRGAARRMSSTAELLHAWLNETATPVLDPICVPTPAPANQTPGEK